MGETQDNTARLINLLALAKAHHERGEHPEAESGYFAILELEPRQFEAIHGLGLLRYQQGRLSQAKELLERALMLNPRSALTHLILGKTLRDLGQGPEALRRFQFSVRLAPRDPHPRFEYAASLQRLGSPQEALEQWDQFLNLTPNDPLAWMNRGLALMDLQREQEALSDFDRAHALKAEWPELLLNQGVAQIQLQHPEAALESFNRALALKPEWAELHMNQAGALHQLGRHRDAIQAYECALVLDPQLRLAHSSKIGLLDFLPELGFQDLQAERVAFFERFAREIPPLVLDVTRDQSPDRRLVIGYVSADFKHHATASCFLPVLQRHTKANFKVICYSGVQIEDDWTARCRACADLWRPVAHLSDDALALQIQQDQVDILVDLSGHTRGNRLLVFARKPAPILVTAWGHGGGTGLPTIDFMFADPVAIPHQARSIFSESIHDLPCHIPFEAPPCSPSIGPLPAQRMGQLTFGCLNAYRKVGPEVVALWAAVLHAVPRARLLLKDSLFDVSENRLQVAQRFQGLGIPRERLEFRGATSREDHLATYGEVDISLDPFPLNGGVSTWESLWMGSPVVAKLGTTLGSRSSAAILAALGLQRWVTHSDSAYVALAREMSENLEALAAFRSGCRALILDSPAGNPDQYTQAVEAAYRLMWHRWVKS